jgi:hypothetical protein
VRSDHSLALVLAALARTPQTGFNGTLATGLAADRPAACESMLGWQYVATDTNGGTPYVCRFDPASGFGWVQAGHSVNVTLGSVAAPATRTSTGTAGQLAYDSGYLYVCIGTDDWKRVAIAIW